jgi:hypothetical protein
MTWILAERSNVQSAITTFVPERRLLHSDSEATLMGPLMVVISLLLSLFARRERPHLSHPVRHDADEAQASLDSSVLGRR